VLSAPSCRIDQGAKQALLTLAENHELRMPLHAQQERVVVAFDGLNDSVLVAGDDAEPRAEPVNRLMVQRVDPLPVATKQGVQFAPGDDLDGLLGQRRVYTGNAGIDVIDALMQGPPRKTLIIWAPRQMPSSGSWRPAAASRSSSSKASLSRSMRMAGSIFPP
jgi:hypothetical protein